VETEPDAILAANTNGAAAGTTATNATSPASKATSSTSSQNCPNFILFCVVFC